ncbi:hypothetical protein BS78_05G109000 [Paspalum vaginatum]|nr:hypothetical protein BS78_05G109000 [Paspalum vaginatum]
MVAQLPPSCDREVRQTMPISSWKTWALQALYHQNWSFHMTACY